MVFSSKTLIWSPLKELHLTPIGVFPSVAPHPYSLASVWIVQSIGASCNDWFQFFRCFNQQCNSGMAEVLSGIKKVLYLPFST